MSDEQLQQLQQLLTQSTTYGLIPVEYLYIYSVALCELQKQLEIDSHRVATEYGTRLLSQISKIKLNDCTSVKIVP